MRDFFDRYPKPSEPEGYDTAQICENGHVITGSADFMPHHREDHCSTCAAKTMMTCGNCNEKIRGHLRGVLSVQEITAPRFCHKCGKPYPWTERSMNAAKELIAEEERLSAEEKEALSKSVDDLVRDTPGTQVAVTRFKKFLPKAGREVAEGVRSVLVGIVSEAAKKALWP